MMCSRSNFENARRANFMSSKGLWTEMDEQQLPQILTESKPGDYKQDSIRQWLISGRTEDANQDTAQCLEQAGSLKRLVSAEDDLILGVEASLYGQNTPRKTVQEYLRSLKSSLGNPVLSRWNSLASSHSAASGIVSVMDVLEFRHDDPEELLLDLGFGMEEPDISIKIPARFINYASQARGINIQVFLQAQKTRMDIENPDFRIRFRQLEVLQQVTSAFSSLVHNGGVATQPPGPVGGGAAQGGPPDAKDKRTKVGMLFRWASKKTISLGQTGRGPSGVPESAEPPETPPSPRRPAFKRARPCLPESASLTPLEEELGPAGDKKPISCPEDLTGPVNDTLMSQPPPKEREPERSLASETGHRVRAAKEPRCGATRRKQGGDREPPESFEMEEIHSFDEGSISGSITTPGAEDILGGGVIRTNSCQSDSSGFLEEPSVPSLLPQSSPAPEVLKYTLEELEGLIRSLRKFRETFVGIEEQLGKEQTSVYDFLSDIDKEEVSCIQELRTAVKEQVNELELQLADLAFNYDEGLNMQVRRLLDEQSYLHAQLKIKTPENQKSTYSSLPDLEIKSTRSVSTQCSLLPEIHFQDMLPLRDAATMEQFLLETGDRDTHPVEDSTQVETDMHARESTSKALKRQEKVDFLAFLQNLKDSFRNSFHRESLE
nr:PREDICTED: coiled-coil domain-containing protein 129 isoform X4 [Lepisosteus oculatus]